MNINYYGVKENIDTVNFDDSYKSLIMCIASKADTLVRKGPEVNLLIFKGQERDYNLFVIPQIYDKGIELKCSINDNNFSLFIDKHNVTFVTTTVKKPEKNSPIYIVNEDINEEEKRKLGKLVDFTNTTGFMRKLNEDKAQLIFASILRKLSNKIIPRREFKPLDNIMVKGMK